MLTERTVYRSDTVRIGEFRCRPLDHRCGGEEVLPTLDITFPRAGAFTRHIGRREYLADPNRIVFFNRNEPYRVSHPVAGGDDGTIFNLSDDALLDIVAGFDPEVRERGDRPFPFRDARSSPALFAAHRRLLQHVQSAVPDSIAVDECALTLVERAIRSAYEDRGRRSLRVKPSTKLVHHRLADDARALLNENCREPLTLDGIARAVHSSAYHLARVFRARTGQSIHHYLNRLRLRASLDRVADGSDDLTKIALDFGFSSHSHFTDNFRREFGFAPSTFRSTATATVLRKMSRNLEV